MEKTITIVAVINDPDRYPTGAAHVEHLPLQSFLDDEALRARVTTAIKLAYETTLPPKYTDATEQAQAIIRSRLDG